MDNGQPQALPLGLGSWNPLNKMSPDAQVSDFYSIQPGPNDRVVSVDASDKVQKRLPDGDVLILVGLHVAVKRHAADWFWATFWWNPDGVGDTFKDKMPPWMMNDPRWRHYAMDLNVTMTIDPEFEYLGPVFNPYIEGLTQFGPTTSCMDCHKNASFPAFDQISHSKFPQPTGEHRGHPSR